jgi:hypothetical protein
MTLNEFSRKYDIRLDWLSMTVPKVGVEPIGETLKKTRQLKDYDEKALVDMVLEVYRGSFLRDKKKAEKWKLKAVEMIGRYRKDHPKPLPDEDD